MQIPMSCRGVLWRLDRNPNKAKLLVRFDLATAFAFEERRDEALGMDCRRTADRVAARPRGGGRTPQRSAKTRLAPVRDLVRGLSHQADACCRHVWAGAQQGYGGRQR